MEGAAQLPRTLHEPLPPTKFPSFEVAVETHIGGRKHQEDRFAVCPQLLPHRNDCAFFGVFDGTVGDFASDTVKDLVVPHLLACDGWGRVLSLLSDPQADPQGDPRGDPDPSGSVGSSLSSALAAAVGEMYAAADGELIDRCRRRGNDYASSTAVTALLVNGFLAVGHLGDSRVALGVERGDGLLSSEFLTVDHKPNMPLEQERIVNSGGSVEYLHNHNNKPFIRGGDFGARKSKGEQPMQLQYSRAFGGKDLKVYGLSAQPDVAVLRLTPAHRLLVLATDGLWDVFTAEQATHIAWQAHLQGVSPAEALVHHALADQQQRGHCADNITAMTVVFK